MEGHLVAANKVGGTHHTGMHSYYNKHLAKFKVPFGILETTVDINEGLFFLSARILNYCCLLNKEMPCRHRFQICIV